MALIKAVGTKKSASLKGAIKYISNLEKTEEGLISGKDCNPETAYQEMQATKELYDKTEGRQYKHFIQSFDPNDKITPEKAHELGREWAEKSFKGHEVLIATHKDKDHVHNHFIVNSVNFENGMKLQQSKDDLKQMKQENNRICEREGLGIIKNQIPGKSLSMNEYQVAMKGESWKFKLMADIDKSMESSRNKAEFIKIMEAKGYKVNWTDTRKYITYTTPEGNKVRDNKLHDSKYLKEEMENGFKRTQENQLQRGTRDNNELRLNWNRVENGETFSRDHSSEQPPKRAEQEIGTERERTDSRNQEGQYSYPGSAQEDRRASASELSKAREGFRNSQRGSEKDTGKQQPSYPRSHGAGAPGQNHPESQLEGKSEAVRSAASDNNRVSNHDRGSVPAGATLENTIKALGNSFEKVQQEEKFKGEQLKAKLERKMQKPQNKKSRGKDWEPEL